MRYSRSFTQNLFKSADERPDMRAKKFYRRKASSTERRNIYKVSTAIA